jgi:hypothetical protein
MPSDFIVKAGQTRVLDQSTILEPFYGRFVLERGSTLQLRGSTPRAVKAFNFDVGELLIADEVTILGNGEHGANGKSKTGIVKPQTGIGDGGYDGDNGDPGQPGSHACDFRVTAVLLHPIGRHFRVELKGGDGGDGGDGGHGGMGGNAGCPQRAGDGGTGGRGGDGGSAGRGGEFLIQASSYDGTDRPLEPTPDQFDVRGGNGGWPGSGGHGGHGGDGTHCGPWGTGYIGGGSAGGNGPRGKRGAGGETKQPRIIGI